MRKNPLTSRTTEAEVECEVKTWIKNAGDRFGGRTERAQKAAKKKKQELRKLRKHRKSTGENKPSSFAPQEQTTSVEQSD